MKKIILICDKCGKSPADRIKIVLGSQSHPSGNGYETIEEYVDLCHSCIKEQYITLLTYIPVSIRKSYFKDLKVTFNQKQNDSLTS